MDGSNFYANWLGFEGNDLEAIIDLDKVTEISSVSIAFLQITNHIVFFLESVSHHYSNDTKNYIKLGIVKNVAPLLIPIIT